MIYKKAIKTNLKGKKMSKNNEILKSSAPPERQLVSFDWAIKKLL